MKKYNVNLDMARINIHDIRKDKYDEKKTPVTPTLKDIAILLYASCGEGVQWSLAYELSNLLGVPYEKIILALNKIVKEYKCLTYKESIDKFFEPPRISDETLRARNEIK